MLSLTVILFLLTLASSAKGMYLKKFLSKFIAKVNFFCTHQLFLFCSYIIGCDDTKWGELKIQYNKCIKTTEQRISSFKSFNQEICGYVKINSSVGTNISYLQYFAIFKALDQFLLNLFLCNQVISAINKIQFVFMKKIPSDPQFIFLLIGERRGGRVGLKV